MNMRSEPISPADYVEPRCLLCDPPYGVTPEVKPVPQDRIIRKLDEYMAKRDHGGVQRHLEYWLEEARLGHDVGGELLVLNEMIGFFRKMGKKAETYQAADQALAMIDTQGYQGTLTAGTTCINAATAYNAFDDNERSLPLFEKALAIYGSLDTVRPEQKAGLYNNMGLTCDALGQFDRAADLYAKALSLMEKEPGGKHEYAITCLNLANSIEAKDGLAQAENRIYDLLDRALDALNDPSVEKDGYDAFVCRSCAPTFSYYGYFAAAEDLEKRARDHDARA